MKGAKIAESNSTTCEWIFHQLAVKNLNVSAEQRSTASVIRYSVFRLGLSGLKNIWPVIMTGIPLSIILSPGWLSSGCLPHKSNQLEPFFCLTQNFCTGELTPIPLSWTGGSKYQCSETNRVCKFYRRVESVWLLLHKFWSHFGIFGVKHHNEKSHFQTFQQGVLACIHYCEGYTKKLWRSADLESSNPQQHSSSKLW